MRETVLLYCQHSLGIGHLTRSFALAAALADHFEVVFLNGGRLPPGLPLPQGVRFVQLPPLGMDDGHTLVSRDGDHDVAAKQAQRRALLDEAMRKHWPALLLVELFPFGRKKFAGEILPLLRQARRDGTRVVCSLRDILVDARPDQQHHDERARWLADRYFDAVLVHADPALARLEDSFHPRREMRTPVHYTGYVVPKRDAAAVTPRGRHLLISAGGGIVGEALFRAALQARELLVEPPPMRVIAGPFLPEAQWQTLQREAAGRPGVELVRQVGDMVAEMRSARASISQCGYNTALDIVVSGVPALVVPYATATENEQASRARRLAERGALRWLAPELLEPHRLAAEIDALLRFTPGAAALDLNGAENSARWLRELCGAVQPEPRACLAA